MAKNTTPDPESELPPTVKPPGMILDAGERSAAEREREARDGITGYEAAKDEPEQKPKSKK